MNKIIAILLVVAVAAGAWFYLRSHRDAFATLTPQQFSQLLADTPDVQLIDVRTPDEYTEGHLTAAKLFDVHDPMFAAKTTTMLAKDKPVAVYCRSGRRSRTAAQVLAKAGYRVYNLDGGIEAWKAAGLPTEP